MGPLTCFGINCFSDDEGHRKAQQAQAFKDLDAPLTPASPELAATLALAHKKWQKQRLIVPQQRIHSGGQAETVRTSGFELLQAVQADQVFVEVQTLKSPRLDPTAHDGDGTPRSGPPGPMLGPQAGPLRSTTPPRSHRSSAVVKQDSQQRSSSSSSGGTPVSGTSAAVQASIISPVAGLSQRSSHSPRGDGALPMPYSPTVTTASSGASDCTGPASAGDAEPQPGVIVQTDNDVVTTAGSCVGNPGASNRSPAAACTALAAAATRSEQQTLPLQEAAAAEAAQASVPTAAAAPMSGPAPPSPPPAVSASRAASTQHYSGLAAICEEGPSVDAPDASLGCARLNPGEQGFGRRHNDARNAAGSSRAASADSQAAQHGSPHGASHVAIAALLAVQPAIDSQVTSPGQHAPPALFGGRGTAAQARTPTQVAPVPRIGSAGEAPAGPTPPTTPFVQLHASGLQVAGSGSPGGSGRSAGSGIPRSSRAVPHAAAHSPFQYASSGTSARAGSGHYGSSGSTASQRGGGGAGARAGAGPASAGRSASAGVPGGVGGHSPSPFLQLYSSSSAVRPAFSAAVYSSASTRMALHGALSRSTQRSGASTRSMDIDFRPRWRY